MSSASAVIFRAAVLFAIGYCTAPAAGIGIAYGAPAADSAVRTEMSLPVAGAMLDGTLLMPAGVRRPPVALLLAGSGATDRDGNSVSATGGGAELRLLGEALARNGIASVRYDKRGVGASRGPAADEGPVLFDQYVDDAAAWLAALRRDPRFSRVVVVGHSEGALVGIMAAQRGGADGVVTLAGPGRPLGSILHEQLARGLPAPVVAESDSIVAHLAMGDTVADLPPALATLFHPTVQPYWISLLRHDPAAEIARLTVPVLVVQGTNDVQVSLDDARRLVAAARPHARLLLVDSMTHPLKLAGADQESQSRAYTDPTVPLAPALVPALVRFIRGGGRGAPTQRPRRPGTHSRRAPSRPLPRKR